MTEPPKEFLDLLPKTAQIEPLKGPIYWLFAFDPQNGVAHVEHNEGRPRANALTHTDLKQKVPATPGLEPVLGYAYKIRGGYRLTDQDHNPIADPFVAQSVVKALKSS